MKESFAESLMPESWRPSNNIRNQIVIAEGKLYCEPINNAMDYFKRKRCYVGCKSISDLFDEEVRRYSGKNIKLIIEVIK